MVRGGDGGSRRGGEDESGRRGDEEVGVGGEWGMGLLLLLGQAKIDVVLLVVGEDGGRRGRVGRQNMEVTR